jgi:hypothetical protein
VDIKRVVGILGARAETVRGMCLAGTIRAQRVGPKLWRVYIDSEGLPGEPGCPITTPGLLKSEWVELGDAAAQCDVDPETIRLLCVTRRIRSRKVGGVIWRVWVNADGLIELVTPPPAES